MLYNTESRQDGLLGWLAMEFGVNMMRSACVMFSTMITASFLKLVLDIKTGSLVGLFVPIDVVLFGSLITMCVSGLAFLCTIEFLCFREFFENHFM